MGDSPGRNLFGIVLVVWGRVWSTSLSVGRFPACGLGVCMSFAVCPSCEGRGSSSAYLGAFIAEEMSQQSEEFAEDYFSRAFDRPCDTCRGQRVVARCAVSGCALPVESFTHPYGGGVEAFAHCNDHLTDGEEQTLMDCHAAWSEARYCGGGY